MRKSHAEMPWMDREAGKFKAGGNDPDPRFQKDPTRPGDFDGDTGMQDRLLLSVTNQGNRGIPACNFNDRCRIRT